MKIFKALAVAISAAFFVAPAFAQNVGTVTSHAFAVGKGPGNQGFAAVLCASAQVAVGQAAADPICRTLSGDVTLTAAGVTAIGANKVSVGMLATLAADSMIGNPTGSTATPQAFSLVNCSNALTYSTSSHAFGCNVSAGTGTVTSATIAPGAGMGAFTGTCTITSTGTCTIVGSASQLPGVATNTAATAGNLGEYISSTVLLAGAQALVSTTDRDVTTVSLTAGDWLCNGNAWSNNAGTLTVWDVWINTAVNTQPTRPGGGAIARWSGSTTTNIGISSGQLHLLISGTTTVSLGANATFSGGTVSAFGFIGCARIR